MKEEERDILSDHIKDYEILTRKINELKEELEHCQTCKEITYSIFIRSWPCSEENLHLIKEFIEDLLGIEISQLEEERDRV